MLQLTKISTSEKLVTARGALHPIVEYLEVDRLVEALLARLGASTGG